MFGWVALKHLLKHRTKASLQKHLVAQKHLIDLFLPMSPRITQIAPF